MVVFIRKGSILYHFQSGLPSHIPTLGLGKFVKKLSKISKQDHHTCQIKPAQGTIGNITFCFLLPK